MDIVHRDIKPANVFVKQDDELVLGDFGIVFVPDQPARLTRTNESVEPHEFMLLRGTKEEVNHRAAAVQWAQGIMRKIDNVVPKQARSLGSASPQTTRSAAQMPREASSSFLLQVNHGHRSRTDSRGYKEEGGAIWHGLEPRGFRIRIYAVFGCGPPNHGLITGWRILGILSNPKSA